jgi:hypothetical protein
MSTEPNPYASPCAKIDVIPPPPGDISEAEALRRKYIKHEASVRSIGVLYYLAGIFLSFISLSTIGIVVALAAGRSDPPPPFAVGLLLVYSALAIVSFVVGRGLRRLRHWARVPVGILSIFGLLQVPIGTLINGYILYLVFSAKGAMVFSPQYQEAIRQTPHVKYRTSMVTWILLAILVVIVLAGILLSIVWAR